MPTPSWFASGSVQAGQGKVASFCSIGRLRAFMISVPPIRVPDSLWVTVCRQSSQEKHVNFMLD